MLVPAGGWESDEAPRLTLRDKVLSKVDNWDGVSVTERANTTGTRTTTSADDVNILRSLQPGKQRVNGLCVGWTSSATPRWGFERAFRRTVAMLWDGYCVSEEYTGLSDS